ncbi:MAG: hypothetical protein JXN60_07395 [Lentisphaerae bacterium]|nr:hypothetical protein [Lentisphaerota bacterium]
MSDRNITRTKRRILVKVLAILFLPVLAVLYLCTVGFPRWLIEEMTSEARTGDYAVFVESGEIDLFHGVILKNVRIHRKGIIGPALAEADAITVEIAWRSIRSGIRVRKLVVDRGIIRPLVDETKSEMDSTDRGHEYRMQLRFNDSIIHGVSVKSLICDLKAKGQRIFLNGLKAVIADGNSEGTLEGDFVYEAEADIVEGDLSAALDPRLLLPVIDAWDLSFVAELVKRFNFSKMNPDTVISFHNKLGSNGVMTVSAKFRMQEFEYQGVDTLRADGGVEIEIGPDRNIVKIDPLLIVRQEGIARGGFVVDMDEQIVELDITCDLDPLMAGQMAGIVTEGDRAFYRFEGPARIIAHGTVGYEDVYKTDLTATLRGRGVGLDKFLAEECSFSIHIAGPTNSLSGILGTIYGGVFSGSAVFVDNFAGSSDTGYTIMASAKDIQFDEMARALMSEPDSDYKGKLSGELEITGLVGKNNVNTARGKGHIKIKEGRVFQLPVFGGLSELMTKIVPGLDFVLRQTDARSEFVIADGKAHSEKVSIEGDVLSLRGYGDYYFDGRLDFFAQVKLMKEHALVAKLLRAITYPLTKLFEFRLKGTFSAPHWYPTNFSGDLLEKMGLRDKTLESFPEAPVMEEQEPDAEKEPE